MEIGTTIGMDYIADLFDSFYLKREYNRNLQIITKAREWCNANGKKLYGLANSGCLNFCSTHIFHDNAHEVPENACPMPHKNIPCPLPAE